ncbi:MAG TPA: amino acid adenylation domain-containing protein, partial [Thermoanaerobaculia bacterium]|nr:amino acid adenylation domain-containing protein [Thermoanaerobaculia bacterium]
THQDLPFERLVGELAPGRDLAVHPLFQVLFTLEEPLLGAAALPGLASAPLDLPDPTAKFDLSLVLTPADDDRGEGGFRASLSYRRDLFDRSTVLRLAGHLSILLEGLAEEPARPLSALPLLGAAERHQLAAEWNDTALVPDAGGAGECPHDLFAVPLRRHPDRVAVEMEGRHLTYAGLDAAANRLALRLVALGVERGSRVAVLLDRCPELLVAFLASSRAGGVYLPLAPTYPRQRLAHLLAESAPAVLLTGERVVERVGHLEALLPPAARVVCLDRLGERAALLALPGDAFPPRARPEDLAYLIYTSGSTGTPKAAMVEHRNLACYLRSVPGFLMTGSGHVVPSWAPVTFDLSLIEWSYALLTGGTVLLVPDERVLDLPALVAGALSRATSLVAVPALLRQIVLHLEETGERGAWEHYGNVSAGGDSVGADLLEAMRRVFPRAVLRNIYGPTETTMLCIAHRVPAVGPLRGDVIGRPVADVVLRLLDRAGNPVPLGVPGEIWVGGGGVGRGYFQRPELTADRYVEREGRRFFRSGDLARYLPDGTLLFLGRQDTQVKLRGQRIELGEIEAALVAQPAIAEAVVALRGEGGAARLVAYVVPRPGERLEAPEIGALRRALAERLPEALVPAAVVVLEALPKSAHGKVDRRALPAPEPRPALEAAPRTPLERAVAAVWQEVLGIERVGIDDNFFELGGSSLLLVRLRSRLAQTLERDVAVVDLFQHPTIRALAEHLARAEGAVPGAPEKQAADLARTQTRRESLARMKERRGRPR